jgi:predicted unusual protein kinase regulating ubiquinone biosynthesis (AarF/ABC1/UbiB family)
MFYDFCSIAYIGIVYLFNRNRRQLFNSLSKFNILSIKLFQAFALNIQDEDLMNDLLIYADSSPFTIENDVDIESLDKLKREHKFRFDIETPINTGMISLVYKAMDVSNNPVIIKIKRKNINSRLNDAIIKIKNFIHFLSYFQYLVFFDILKIEKYFIENTILITQQLDFNLERKNIKYMKKLAEPLTYVVIPKVFEEYCNDNIIVMEFINGLHISQVPEINYKTYAELGIKYMLISLMLNGSVHGDLHCGNMLFLEEPTTQAGEHKLKIGIIDFGLVYNINDKFRDNFMEVMLSIFTKDPVEAATCMFYSGIIEPKELLQTVPDFHKTALIKIIAEVIEKIIHKDKQGGIMEVCNLLGIIHTYIKEKEIENMFAFWVNPEFIKIQLVMAMVQGICITLCKEKHIEVINECIIKLFHLDLLQD